MLNASNYQLIFTATGTESNHLGIRGYAQDGHALVGAIEHPSSLNSVEARDGGSAVLPVTADGRIDVKRYRALLRDDVKLISVQWVNNELGCIQPLRQLVQLARQLAPRAHFHVDAIQAAGKFVLHFDQLGADSYAIAAHKFGGIRGCAGFFYKKGGRAPEPTFVGGGHELGIRSGTENTMGIAAMAAALEQRQGLLIKNSNFLHDSRQKLLKAIAEQCDIELLGPQDETLTSGSIISFVMKGMRAEPFLHQLETHGIYIGSGSACNAHGHSESATLAAIGLKEEMRNSVLRISFSDSLSDALALRVATAMALTVAFFKD